MGRNDLCFCNSGKKQKNCHPDIKEDSYFANLVKLYNSVNNKIEQDSQPDKLKCHKGCSECCHHYFSITPVEYFYIIYRLLNDKGVDITYSYLKKGNQDWLSFQQECPENAQLLNQTVQGTKTTEKASLLQKALYTAPTSNKFPCVFLNPETNSCDIYEYRPYVCRTFGVGYEDKENALVNCSKNTDGEDYSLYMADLSSFVEEYSTLNLLKGNKFNTTAMERSYPLFAFCKTTYNYPVEIFSQIINEFKNYSREQCSDLKLARNQLK